MVATYTAQHARSLSERRIVEYDVDGALNIVDLGQPQGAGNSCLPIALFRSFLAGLFRSVGTGGVTAFSIIGATDAAGTGATAIVSHALGSAPDAVGDTVWLECNAEQIREVMPTATHVGIQVDLVTAGDECVFFFERGDPLYNAGALTADYVA